MERLAQQLTRQASRPVLDKTGLTGRYDFTLEWTDVERFGAADAGAAGGSEGPSIFAALQEQLGLRLESQRGPVEVIVIERVERPSEN